MYAHTRQTITSTTIQSKRAKKENDRTAKFNMHCGRAVLSNEAQQQARNITG